MLVHHFQLLARYNTLANQRLYTACAQLSEADRQQIRPAFFKSIHGTLNHILVGDRIWMTRFRGGTVPSTGLDAILYADFDALWATRVLEDQTIQDFANGLTDEFLARSIAYVNNAGKPYEDPAHLLIAHFFNHQTHHRGQIHDLLTQTQIKPPVLDLHRVINP